MSPLIHAAKNGHKEIVELLLRQGIDDDAINTIGILNYKHSSNQIYLFSFD